MVYPCRCPQFDWELYRRLKAVGRLNLLFRFSEPAGAGVQCAEAPTSRSQLLRFVSRAEHLAWRQQWKNGRWVKLSWTPEQREVILRQDEAYRRADARWVTRHDVRPSLQGHLEDVREPLPAPGDSWWHRVPVSRRRRASSAEGRQAPARRPRRPCHQPALETREGQE